MNQGWYGEPLDDERSAAQGLPPAQMQAYPLEGYIAPPLDGVWATAPYLHNGSVPTLELLLNSPARPTRWRRDFGSSQYDLNALGWPHEELSPEANLSELSELSDPSEVYDGTVTGYSPQGHTFGDHLSVEERAALIEYLKAL